jgi:hypothetical protein
MADAGLLVQDLDWIVALDANPVLRNLLITQSYHDLSQGMSGLLGSQNANWCTYATWASRTAGRFIRDDEVPTLLRSLIEQSPSYVEAKARLGRLGFDFDRDCLLQLPGEIVGVVSAQIMLGNLKVYSELGPVFARMIQAFHPDRSAAPGALASVLDTLSEGPSDRGGQTMLRSGVSAYFAAMKEADPKKKAELILLANAQVGLHEQIRLQPYIADSLGAPVAASVNNLAAALLRPLADRLRDRAEPLVDNVLRPLITGLERDWNQIATRELMTLTVPGETLRLGRPLPPLPGQPLCPTLLEAIDHFDLRTLLEHFRCLTIEATATALDWATLDERMKYILNLFRSRQMTEDFFSEPFTDSQRAAILERKVPAGPLA